MVAYQAKGDPELFKKAQIYGRNSDKPLTKYQAAINEAAIKIAKDNPMAALIEVGPSIVRCLIVLFFLSFNVHFYPKLHS